MTRMKDDFDDFDADDLSPELAAQLERLERTQHFRAQEQTRLRTQKLRVRRRLEDWGEDRRLRDEIDYLSGP